MMGILKKIIIVTTYIDFCEDKRQFLRISSTCTAIKFIVCYNKHILFASTLHYDELHARCFVNLVCTDVAVIL